MVRVIPPESRGSGRLVRDVILDVMRIIARVPAGQLE